VDVVKSSVFKRKLIDFLESPKLPLKQRLVKMERQEHLLLKTVKRAEMLKLKQMLKAY
jgi:hypothetical protein